MEGHPLDYSKQNGNTNSKGMLDNIVDNTYSRKQTKNVGNKARRNMQKTGSHSNFLDVEK